MGERGKKKFTFIVGYKDYLEKTIRAHGNCTLFNARNRGTLIFSCERLFHPYIFITRLSQGADIFFNSLVFQIIYELLANGTRADVDFFFSKEILIGLFLKCSTAYRLLRQCSYWLVQASMTILQSGNFGNFANLSHRRSNKMILILISWNKEKISDY